MNTKRPGRGAAAADDIIVAVPVELKCMAESMEQLIDATMAARGRGRGGRAIDYHEVEQTIAKRTAEIERTAHASILSALDVDAPRVLIGGEEHARVGRALGTYFTLAGKVEVERTVYRSVRVRSGPIVDPIKLRTGAFGRGWLPMTAQAIAHHVQQGTSREAAASAAQGGRLPYSRASFERVAHEVGSEWLCHHADIEDGLAQEFELPEAACTVSVALDRVSVPMEEPAKRPPGRPRKDAPKRSITRQYRMAYCGTVTLHDEEGGALHTIRYGCMPESDPALLCAEMANEVFRLREQRDLKVVLLADGAPEMWNLLESNFPEEVFGPVARLVDFWHLVEKLSPAAKVIFGEAGAVDDLHRWRKRLCRTSNAATEILDELRDSGRERAWRDSKQPVREAITYIENHLERMDYASARRRRLPIGSGNVEATCKTLVAMRLKRAGARWKHETGEHVLRLRALALSDRWDAGLQRLHAQRRTAVRAVA